MRPIVGKPAKAEVNREIIDRVRRVILRKDGRVLPLIQVGRKSLIALSRGEEIRWRNICSGNSSFRIDDMDKLIKYTGMPWEVIFTDEGWSRQVTRWNRIDNGLIDEDSDN